MGNTTWTYRPLSELCDINIGKTPSRSKKEYWGKGHTWVSISDLKSKTIFTTKEEITDIALTDSNIRMVKKGTLLMSFKLSIGKLAFAGKDLYTNEAIVGLPVKRGIELDSNYLYYALGFIPLAGGNQAAMGQTLNKKSLAALLIPLPPTIEEQKRIAKILLQCESLIQKRKVSIELLNELLNSTFLEMFGDPFINPKGLPLFDLEYVAKDEKNAIVDGPFGSSIKQSDYRDEGVPIIRINNIRFEGFYDNDYKYISQEKYQELIRSKVEFEDILIARVGNTIGKTCLFDKKFKALLSTTGVAKASINTEKALVQFILVQMQLPQYIKYIWNQTAGGGQPYLNLKKIKGFKLLVPDLKYQKDFVTVSSKIENLKSQFKISLLEFRNLYGSLSQRAFKGELDLSKVDISDMEDSTQEKPEMEPIGDPRWEGKVELQDYQVHIDEIIRKDFENISFSFKQLESAIADRGVYVPYEGVKEFVFKSLEGNESLLVQELDEKDKQIVFKIRS